MTQALPRGPRFAADDVPSRPLHVITPDVLDAALGRLPEAQANWARANAFAAKAGELVLLPGASGQIEAALAGLGDAAARARQRFALARAFVALPPGDWHLDGALSEDLATEAALAWGLSQWSFDRYRPGKTAKQHAGLKLPAGCDGARIEAMLAGEFLTRTLIDTPAEDMGPDALEAAFFALAEEAGATARAIRGDDLLAQNFPMIHAVGRASTRAPRLLDLRWGESGPQLTLVGKGVCFDTGGLDLKPSAGMLLMKKDMGGAATVMGLARMIMTLRLPIRLRVLVPAVENMVAGGAMRPKDILTSRKGLTVEVNNTDAEGRLVLADALALACEEESDLIVSMATLTGAARVAVGPDLAPFYANDDAQALALSRAALPAFDPVWRMPFHTPYEAMIEPGIADLDNAPSGGFAGSITAALFLRRFVSNPNYLHFDIYGHSPSNEPGRPKGGAGQGARALLLALPELLDLP